MFNYIQILELGRTECEENHFVQLRVARAYRDRLGGLWFAPMTGCKRPKHKLSFFLTTYIIGIVFDNPVHTKTLASQTKPK